MSDFKPAGQRPHTLTSLINGCCNVSCNLIICIYIYNNSHFSPFQQHHDRNIKCRRTKDYTHRLEFEFSLSPTFTATLTQILTWAPNVCYWKLSNKRTISFNVSNIWQKWCWTMSSQFVVLPPSNFHSLLLSLVFFWLCPPCFSSSILISIRLHIFLLFLHVSLSDVFLLFLCKHKQLHLSPTVPCSSFPSPSIFTPQFSFVIEFSHFVFLKLFLPSWYSLLLHCAPFPSLPICNPTEQQLAHSWTEAWWECLHPYLMAEWQEGIGLFQNPLSDYLSDPLLSMLVPIVCPCLHIHGL